MSPRDGRFGDLEVAYASANCGGRKVVCERLRMTLVDRTDHLSCSRDGFRCRRCMLGLITDCAPDGYPFAPSPYIMRS